MNKELKKAIVNWLLDNEDRYQRVNECKQHFRNYIYDDNGNHLIGGKEVSEFVNKAERLLYS